MIFIVIVLLILFGFVEWLNWKKISELTDKLMARSYEEYVVSKAVAAPEVPAKAIEPPDLTMYEEDWAKEGEIR